MPSVSWVARWNGLEGNKPGVYAVSVFDSEQMDGESDIDMMAPNNKQKKKKRNHNDGEMLYSDQDADEFYTWNILSLCTTCFNLINFLKTINS